MQGLTGDCRYQHQDSAQFQRAHSAVLRDAVSVPEDIYLDALDTPGCPRCASSLFEHDAELHAVVCDDCGLWIDDEPQDPDDSIFL